jgi:actin-like ATPase involved in cell morphogenesis
VLHAEAQRVIAQTGEDFTVVVPQPDGTLRPVKAGEAMARVQEQQKGADELTNCLGGKLPEGET